MDMDEVIKGLTELKKYLPSTMWEPINNAIALLKEQEAEGKWIYGEDETGVDGWHCSECNFFEPWFYEFTDDIDFIRFYGFCPKCGAKMASYTGKPTET
jgi:hypothetical protein